MMTLTEHNVNKVLKKLINMPKNAAECIYCPANFRRRFPFISSESLRIILKTLENRCFIAVDYNDDPKCFYIEALAITPEGYSYAMQQDHISRKDFIRFLIPIIISLISLTKSFQNEITSLLKLLMQSMK